MSVFEILVENSQCEAEGLKNSLLDYSEIL